MSIEKRMLAVVTAVVVIIATLLMLPSTREGRYRSCAVVQRVTTWQLLCGDSVKVLLSSDTLYRPAVWHNRWLLFASCRGRVATSMPETDTLFQTMSPTEALEVFTEQTDNLLDYCRGQLKELDYYLRVHAMQDEGYSRISEYAAELRQRTDSIDCLSNVLHGISRSAVPTLQRTDSYRVYYKGEGETLMMQPLNLLSARPVSKHGDSKEQYLSLQTANCVTPAGVRAISMWRWAGSVEDYFYIGKYGSHGLNVDLDAAIAPGIGVRHTVATDTLHGMGTVQHGKFLYKGTLSEGLPNGYGVLAEDSQWVYRGAFRKGLRQGSGTARIAGRLIRNAIYHADTLQQGSYTDTLGFYVGEMNRMAVPNGHGIAFTLTGERYEGAWQNGCRSGFGFAYRQDTPLQCGEWLANRFLGERMLHSSERIYGIDIARYQHESGNKRYAIDWNHLRITDLGSQTRKQIDGKVDYPVSFLYIKSTEGTTVKNSYFASDYAAARRHSIRVGAYHFFSTKSSGKDQAAYYLRQTKFQKGDMPPVLDVEPSDRQIEQMGGAEVMWKHIRTWLTMVEEHTHTRPVLYISQSFVNKYLGMVPDVRDKYDVWIARYNEYAPNVHLVYWQLCADGRVKGIQGSVDINVFNGYAAEYSRFTSDKTIR